MDHPGEDRLTGLIDLRTEKEFSEYHIPERRECAADGAGGSRSEQDWRRSCCIPKEASIPHRHGSCCGRRDTARHTCCSADLRNGRTRCSSRSLRPMPHRHETVEFAKMSAVSRYFGGTPQSGTADSVQTPAVVTAETRDAGIGARPLRSGAPKKKKKEGC